MGVCSAWTSWLMWFSRPCVSGPSDIVGYVPWLAIALEGGWSDDVAALASCVCEGSLSASHVFADNCQDWQGLQVTLEVPKGDLLPL